MTPVLGQARGCGTVLLAGHPPTSHPVPHSLGWVQALPVRGLHMAVRRAPWALYVGMETGCAPIAVCWGAVSRVPEHPEGEEQT